IRSFATNSRRAGCSGSGWTPRAFCGACATRCPIGWPTIRPTTSSPTTWTRVGSAFKPFSRAGRAATIPSATLDHLAGEWKIFQLKGGHRFSADDVLTAWIASRARPDALRILDLGSGIGSVGLLTLFRLGLGARLVGVEVQEVSLDLAR